MKKALQITTILLCIICVNVSCNKEKTKSELIIGKWECLIATLHNELEGVEHHIGGRWEFNDKEVSMRDGFNQDLGNVPYSYDEKNHILTIEEDYALRFYVTKLTTDIMILDENTLEYHFEFVRLE